MTVMVNKATFGLNFFSFSEREKEGLQERIMTLVQENDTLATRLQEVVSVSRNLSGHVHSVKDQLERVEAEKDDLHRKVRLVWFDSYIFTNPSIPLPSFSLCKLRSCEILTWK